MEINHLELTRPFRANQIKWRLGATNGEKSKGVGLAYIDARDVMQRLDGCAGFGSWQCTYPATGVCELSIKVDGEWITKTNVAGETRVEAEKGQASDAFKRAAVLWGIGRYLYYLPNVWSPIKPVGTTSHKLVSTPSLPDWALPEDWETIYPEMFGVGPYEPPQQTQQYTKKDAEELLVAHQAELNQEQKDWAARHIASAAYDKCVDGLTQIIAKNKTKPTE